MGKGLERATGEEALGSKLCSHQQAVPPLSVGQEPGSSHRDYLSHRDYPSLRDYPHTPCQARLAIRAFPLPALSRSSPATKLRSV